MNLILPRDLDGFRPRLLWVCGLLVLVGSGNCQQPGQEEAKRPGRESRVERWMDNPERIIFAVSKIEHRPARVDSYWWDRESIGTDWDREQSEGWITLVSPRLHYRSLGEIDRIELALVDGSSPSPLALFWDDSPELSPRARLKNKLQLTSSATAGQPTRFSIEGETLADVDAFVPEGGETPPRHFFLRFPVSAPVRIKVIQVIGTQAGLSGRNQGVTRRTRAGQVRDTLFCRTPCSISYRPERLSAGDLLWLGLHSQLPGVALDYSVALETGDHTQLLLDSRLPPQPGWHDFRLLLTGDLNGAEIKLRAASQRPGDVVFWANPLIVPSSRPQARPNLILYVIDSLRADRVGGPASPAAFISSLADSGLYFENCYATAPWTKPSVTSLMTSLHPLVHGVGRTSFADILPESALTLQDSLRKNGYVTASFSANPFSSTVSNLDQGFDYVYTPNAFHQGPATAETKIYSDDLNRHLLPWIRAHAGHPFFIFVHSMDAHPPLQVLSESPDPVPSRRDLYAQSIRRNDAQLRRLLEQLKDQQLDTATLLIITADHGHAWGDHGQYGHGLTVYQEEIRVPLLWFHGGHLAPGRVQSPVSLLDVYPSLLSYLDIPFDPSSLEGRSLLPAGSNADAREILVSQFLYPEDAEIARYRDHRTLAMIAGRWKLILRQSPHLPNRYELYDLERDPAELSDLAGSEAFTVRRLQQRMNALITQLETRRSRFREANSAPEPDRVPLLDAETLRRLRSLGYIQ